MNLTRVAKDAAHVAVGAVRYRVGRPRTVAVILSSMRSGSTVLKALLGQAPDVSHLPEIVFSQYRAMPPYKAYNLVCGLSPKPIVVLKRPIYDDLVLPFAPEFLRLKIIVLVRNAVDVASSVVRMSQTFTPDYPEPWSAARAIAYWRDAYRLALDHPELSAHALLTVRYEDLVAQPLEQTARAFAHLGSVQREGVTRYGRPESFEWRWGSDDGGKRIQSLEVSAGAEATEPPDPQVIEALRADPGAIELMQRLGYALPWDPAAAR